MSYPSGRRFEWSVRNLLESFGWVTVRAVKKKYERSIKFIDVNSGGEVKIEEA